MFERRVYIMSSHTFLVCSLVIRFLKNEELLIELIERGLIFLLAKNVFAMAYRVANL